MPDISEGELTDEKLTQELEDIEAKISEIEDRTLTNELNFQRIEKDVKGSRESPTPEALQSKLTQMEEKLEEDLEDVEKWKGSFKNVIDKLNQLEEDVEDLKKTGTETPKSGSGESSEKLLNRINELEGKISEKKVKKDETGDVDELKEMVGKNQERIRELKERIDNIGSPSNSDQADISKRMEEDVETLKDRLDKLDERIENLDMEVSNKPGKNEMIDKVLSEIDVEGHIPTDRFDDIENGFENLEERLDGIDERLEEIEEDKEDLSKRLDANLEEGPSKEEFESIENTVNKLEENVDGVKDRIKSVSEKVEKTPSEEDMLERVTESMGIKDIQNRIDSLEDSLEDVRNKVPVGMEEDVEELRNELDELKSEESEDRFKELAERLEQIEKDEKNLSEKIKSMDTGLDEDDVDNRINSLEDKFENKLTSLEDALEKYIDEKLSEGDIEDVKKEEKSLSDQVNNIKKQISEQENLESEVEKLKKEVSSLKKEIQKESVSKPVILE